MTANYTHDCIVEGCNHDCGTHCERVRLRMACPECKYPPSEAMFALNISVLHTDCPQAIEDN